MRKEVVERIVQEKIIAIVRGIDSDKCIRTAEALYEGGIHLIEVTFNQKNPETFQETADMIMALNQRFGGRILVGAGTVITPELVDLAASAGAEYIISPDVNVAVIRRTLELGLVSIPGAMTPTEVMEAHRAGADYVKLFPAGSMGVEYVKAVCTPISHVKLLAVGGIDEKNIAEFLNVGMVGAGIGGNLVNKKWIEAGEYEKITETAKKLLSVVNV